MKILSFLGTVLASHLGLFIHIGLLLAATAFLIRKPLSEFHTYDIGPTLIEAAPTLSAQAPEVEVGFTLTNFSRFDAEKNDFIANGVVWFIFNPQEITPEQLGAFSFRKAEVKKSTPIIQQYKDRSLARYFVRLRFTSNLDYRDFPLDDHRIFLTLKNDTLTSDDVHFISSKGNVFVEPDHLHLATWQLIDYDAQAGYDTLTLKEEQEIEEIYYPHVVFSFDYDRVGIHLIMLILIPLLFVFFVALSMFLLKTDEAGDTFRGILFSLVGYLFVLETITPPAGYLILSDYVYFSIFICSFLVTTLSLVAEKFSMPVRGFIGTAIELGLLALLSFILQVWR